MIENTFLRGQMPKDIQINYDNFLAEAGLRDEGDCDCIVLLQSESSGKILACGAVSGRVLKQIAVDKAAEGCGLCAHIITRLTEYAACKNEIHLFLYTKPEHKALFSSLGFTELVSTESVLMMENKKNGLNSFLRSLPKGSGKIGAVVVNCNPFTLGHKYLIDFASKNCDFLYVFVLSEDSSLIPANDRYELVKKGTEDLANVYVIQSREYLVSKATFPSYFIKEEKECRKVKCELDLALFAKRIAPALNIKVRFAGEEPFDVVTRYYNESMRKILPAYGIEFVEVQRYMNISARAVRELLQKGLVGETKQFLPEVSYEYCRSKFGTDASGQR